MSDISQCIHVALFSHPQVVQSPDKHRQAIAELAAAAEAQRTYYAQLGNTAIENDRKLEMVGKVCDIRMTDLVMPKWPQVEG